MSKGDFSFKTPIRVEDDIYVVADDHELIFVSSAHTKEELTEIVDAVNSKGELLDLLEVIRVAEMSDELLEEIAQLLKKHGRLQ